MSACVKIYEDDDMFIRDDLASGIDADNDKTSRYSVFSRTPYRRLRVYCGSAEYAVQQFNNDREQFLREIANERSNWDRDEAVRLRMQGLTQSQVGYVLGRIAEHRQTADLQGYARGFNSGHEAAKEAIATKDAITGE